MKAIEHRTFAFLQASMIASQSATVQAIGFSIRMCLPALAAAMRLLGVDVVRRGDEHRLDVLAGQQRLDRRLQVMP